MLSRILVTSDSNVELVRKEFGICFDELVIVDKPPNSAKFKIKAREVYALGGGSVIDTAKMISGDRPCYAIPTTASGSATTSWAVVWYKNRKVSVKCALPVLIEAYRNMDIKLPKKVEQDTHYDCLCHILDSGDSIKGNDLSKKLCKSAFEYLVKWGNGKNINDLIDAGNLAGRAIEITGTNYLHAMSYVLTLDYGLTHGGALRECFNLSTKYDWDKITKKAKKYPKFYERKTC